MHWQFPLFLFAALTVGMVLSFWQNRRYTAEAKRLARAHAGSANLRLVSGRGKGRLRGALVVLVVNPTVQRVVDASAMQGSTVFSQLHPAPQLVGPYAEVRQRVTGDKQLRTAVDSALAMVPGA